MNFQYRDSHSNLLFKLETWRQNTYIYTSFRKNYIHIIYQYCIATNFSCCFLEEFHLVLLLATTWRPNLWVLRKIWLSKCLRFENHVFLIINQKVGYPAIYIYTVYFPKFCCLKKPQNTLSTKMFCICKIYC